MNSLSSYFLNSAYWKTDVTSKFFVNISNMLFFRFLPYCLILWKINSGKWTIIFTLYEFQTSLWKHTYTRRFTNRTIQHVYSDLLFSIFKRCSTNLCPVYVPLMRRSLGHASPYQDVNKTHACHVKGWLYIHIHIQIRLYIYIHSYIWRMTSISKGINNIFKELWTVW